MPQVLGKLRLQVFSLHVGNPLHVVVCCPRGLSNCPNTSGNPPHVVVCCPRGKSNCPNVSGNCPRVLGYCPHAVRQLASSVW